MSFYLRFDFFNRTLADEVQTENLKDLKMSCTHFGRSCLWIGDLEGIIYRFHKDFSSSMFIGYEKCVTLIHQCKEKDLLITTGMENTIGDVVKIWNLSKWSKQNVPTLLRTINHGTYNFNDFKVIALSVLNNLSCMALGLADGRIDLHYNDILLSKRCKRKQIYKLPEKVTSVTLNQEKDHLYVFVTSASRIVVLICNVSSTSSNSTEIVKVGLESEVGCPLHCSELIDNTLFVASEKGIYEIYPEEMGRCRAMDGDKISMCTYKNYLVVVKLIKPSILAGTHLLKKSDQRSSQANYQVMVFDRINKFIAGEFLISDFNFLFVEWGSIFIYSGYPTNKMIILTEKDIQTKLKIFIQKNNFGFAIETAKAQHFDEDALADMYRQYGDHLYRQKFYDEAVQAYIKTVGKVEPSFIIGKFLDTAHIKNLSDYMEALIQQDQVSGEHLVVLFNCYIILKDRRRLSGLIKSHQIVSFELDNIINLLRKVELFEEALQLAARYSSHDWYLKVLVEDLHRYDQAIDYIGGMPLEQAEEALLRHGDTLINICPQAIAKQLERVCDQQGDSKLSIATILNVFANNRKGLKHFLSGYIAKFSESGDCYGVYVDTYLELLLFEFEKEKDNSASLKTKIMDILQSTTLKYHKSKALMSCQQRGFLCGYRYLCELNEKYLEILDSYKDEHDVRGIMNTCHQFGAKKPDLWVQALEYLVENNADEEFFLDVIKEIEARSLISPLLLLQKMTGGKKTLKFGLVKEFIMHYYDQNENLIAKYQEEIDKLKDETRKNDDIIKCLHTEVQVFQNLKCMTCSIELETPSVHFLCGHSYHQRCFETYGNASGECPNCSPNIDQLVAEINQWQTTDDKLTGLGGSNPLSLERLWCTILSQASHPISINPDQFIAGALAASLVDSTGVNKKFLTDNATINSFDAREPTPPVTLSVKSEPSTKSTAARPPAPVTQTNPIDIAPTRSPSQILSNSTKIKHQSPSSSSSSSQKPPTSINPFDSPMEAIRNISAGIRNPFDTSQSPRNSPATSTKQHHKNPFDEETPSNEEKYPKTKNPFDL